MSYLAIGFQRVGGSGRLEFFTSTTDGDVTTQQTALSTTNKFSAGAYQGVAVVAAWLYSGAQVTNFKNNISTRVNSYASRTLITGGTFQNNAEVLEKYGVVVLSATAGANNNLDIEDFNIAKLASATGGFSISGLQNGKAGKTVTLLNATSQILTITNQGGSSDAENRIITGTGGNLQVAGPCAVTFTYDSNASRWDLISSSKPSVGSGGVVDSVVAGTGITVDATDPANPIVESTVTAVVETIVAGSNVVVDATDPANPIVTAKSPATFSGATNVGTAARYFHPNGLTTINTINSPTSPLGCAPIPCAGTLKNLRIFIDAAAAVGGDALTVLVNGVASALVATIAQGATTGNNNADDVAVVAGDKVTVQWSTNSGGASQIAWAFTLEGVSA